MRVDYRVRLGRGPSPTVHLETTSLTTAFVIAWELAKRTAEAWYVDVSELEPYEIAPDTSPDGWCPVLGIAPSWDREGERWPVIERFVGTRNIGG
jgi:hypothetical protein